MNYFFPWDFSIYVSLTYYKKSQKTEMDERFVDPFNLYKENSTNYKDKKQHKFGIFMMRKYLFLDMLLLKI